jgi:iron complex outermembrane receptor protein
VSVRIDGTTLGTQTRADGGFTISGVPAGARALRVQRIGFRAQTVPVDVAANGTATANVTLAAVAAQLTEVVAVAYSSGGAQDRRNVTGSVAAVDSSLFNKGRVVSAEDLIQAKVAGVQVVSSNEPGGGITVRVRGQASVNGVNDPLFVVDGIPLAIGGGLSGGRNPLNFINPQDIANVTVLKDAQATAIYGSRGSNGVVLITTKNGSQGGAQVTYGVNYSNRQVARAPDLLSAEQFRAAVTQYGSTNVGLLNQSNASTDWFDALAQSGGGQEHNLAVGGTRQSLAYRLSLGYLEDEGVLRGDNTNRLSGQFNYSDRLFKDVVDVQATLRAVRTKDAFGGGRFLGDALGFSPTRPIFNSDGTFFATGNVLENRNPLANLALQRQHRAHGPRASATCSCAASCPSCRALGHGARQLRRGAHEPDRVHADDGAPGGVQPGHAARPVLPEPARRDHARARHVRQLHHARGPLRRRRRGRDRRLLVRDVPRPTTRRSRRAASRPTRPASTAWPAPSCATCPTRTCRSRAWPRSSAAPTSPSPTATCSA